MAHQSLYRRHRPQRFAELVGQEHVSTALRNAVHEGRVGHAYLFSGPRGTGKTTTARILAKALNCLDPGPDGDPCGKCENCEAIAAGTFFDLAELDAASNNGVDAIRDLVQSVGLGLGATSRRKVYLVDEVHMLSAAASNALLKTLEEPPEHVVFVLATTDPGKVLPTIRSRTQHFEFTLLSHEQLVSHLADVLAREGVEADAEALDVIARRAAGSARDALSVLDQALALGEGTLDPAKVRDVLGDTPLDQRVAILEAVANEDAAGALVAVASSLAGGVEPRRLADDLLKTLRDAFVLDAAAGRVPYDGPPEDAERLTTLAAALGRPTLTRGVETLGQAIVDIRGPAVPDPRLVLEVAVVRLARRDSRSSADALLDRVERLERRVEQLATGSGAPSGGQPPVAGPARQAPPRPPAASEAVLPPRPGGADPAPEAEAGSPAGPGRSALGAHLAARPARSAPATGVAGGPQPFVGREAARMTGSAKPAGSPAAEAPGEPPAFDLDDVVEAWPDVMAALKPPLRAAIEDAQPVAVQGSVVVFGVPPRRIEAIRNRFQAEADTIRTVLGERLGAPPQFRLRPYDFEAPGAFVGRGPTGGPVIAPAQPTASGARVEDPDDDPIDLEELVDAGDDVPNDSAARLIAELGAQVVEERSRD